MNPEEAVTAARILQADLVVPIHYESLHKPPIYIETANPVKRLLDQSSLYKVNSIAYKVGEWFDI
jgi:L-ascorbate metabolism protein UlaG (beta-lactamase superfamily)